MNICNNEHEEICHEGPCCPICDQLEELNEELSEVKTELNDKTREYDALEEKYEELREFMLENNPEGLL